MKIIYLSTVFLYLRMIFKANSFLENYTAAPFDLMTSTCGSYSRAILIRIKPVNIYKNRKYVFNAETALEIRKGIEQIQVARLRGGRANSSRFERLSENNE